MGKERNLKNLRKELGYKPGTKTNYKKTEYTVDEHGNKVSTVRCVGLRGEYLKQKKEG